MTGSNTSAGTYHPPREEDEAKLFEAIHCRNEKLIEKLNIVRELLASLKKKSITPIYVDRRVSDIEHVFTSLLLTDYSFIFVSILFIVCFVSFVCSLDFVIVLLFLIYFLLTFLISN